MSAPIGNKFWLQRSSHGRNPIFATPDDLWAACLEYFEWVDKHPLYEQQAFAYQGDIKVKNMAKMRAMTLSGLCIFIDVARSTWNEWRESREDFSDVIAQVDEIIRDQKFSGASAGLLNPHIIARDLGLADKKELSGPDGGPIQTKTEVDLGKALQKLTDEELEALRGIAAKVAAAE